METIKFLNKNRSMPFAYISLKRQVGPEEVLVELMYDDDYGFSAEVEVNGRQQILIKRT